MGNISTSTIDNQVEIQRFKDSLVGREKMYKVFMVENDLNFMFSGNDQEAKHKTHVANVKFHHFKIENPKLEITYKFSGDFIMRRNKVFLLWDAIASTSLLFVVTSPSIMNSTSEIEQFIEPYHKNIKDDFIQGTAKIVADEFKIYTSSCIDVVCTSKILQLYLGIDNISTIINSYRNEKIICLCLAKTCELIPDKNIQNCKKELHEVIHKFGIESHTAVSLLM